MLNQTSVTEFFLLGVTDIQVLQPVLSSWFSLQFTFSIWLEMEPSWWLSSLIQDSILLCIFPGKPVMSRYLLLHGDSAKDAGELPLYTQNNFFLRCKSASFSSTFWVIQRPCWCPWWPLTALWLSANHFITLLSWVIRSVPRWLSLSGLLGFPCPAALSNDISLKLLWFQPHPSLLLWR